MEDTSVYTAISDKGDAFTFRNYNEFLSRADGIDTYTIGYDSGPFYELFHAFTIDRINFNRWEFFVCDINEENFDHIICTVRFRQVLDVDNISLMMKNVSLFAGTPEEYVRRFVKLNYRLDEVSAKLYDYIDYQRWSRDMISSRKIYHTIVRGTEYVVTIV